MRRILHLGSLLTGFLFCAGFSLLPVYLCLMWLMLSVRMNVTRDIDLELWRFFISVGLPPMAVLAALFGAWRLLARFDESVNGVNWSGR
jgi:hypothetical protein